jgi:AraC-like DNA-binding protein
MHMRHWTLGLVRLGLAELESPAGTRRIEAGGFFLVPPRVPHCLRLAGYSELLTLCLDEEGETFPGLCRLLSDREEREALTWMYDQFVRQTQAVKKQPLWGAMRGLAERLVAQPEEGLTLSEMARFAYISPWHLLRRFRLATGMTPHAFLLNCKIRRLRSLLRGGMTAADAAAHTGFTDQSHMHKLFKLHHNLTPRQFVLASGRLDDPGAPSPIANPRRLQ